MADGPLQHRPRAASLRRQYNLWLHAIDVALQRPAARRLMLVVAIGWAFMATVGAVALWVTQNQESAQALHTCEINNVVRSIQNKSENADFPVFQFVYQRFSIPTKTETPAQRAITDQLAGKLRESLDSKIWVTLTNCAATPGSQSVKAFKLLNGPAPAYAMSLKNASLPSPKGSVP